jgi:hypothetical protein
MAAAGMMHAAASMRWQFHNEWILMKRTPLPIRVSGTYGTVMDLWTSITLDRFVREIKA